jgi:hypothetical protein
VNFARDVWYLATKEGNRCPTTFRRGDDLDALDMLHLVNLVIVIVEEQK